MREDDLDKAVIDALEKLGIKGYELKAYLTILRLGEDTAPNIASEAGIPLPRIYSVLDSLLKKGLIEVRMGRPRKYRAIQPSISLIHYARRRISELAEIANMVVDRLTAYYRESGEEKEEPILWMMYNIDVGIEKMKHMVLSLSIDGFLSLNTELLKKTITTLAKALSAKAGSVFGVTILSKDIPHDIMDTIERTENIIVKTLPTGIVNMVETDLSNLLVFGSNYVIHSAEWELIVIANESFYHGYWRLAKKVKDIVIRRNHTYKTTHHWLALDVISNALSSGYNVYARIKGYRVGGLEPIEAEGYVKGIHVTGDSGIRSIYIEGKNGETISVGGIGASVEDIEARYLELLVE